MSETIKTTVYLNSAEYRQLRALARAQGRPAASLVREAVALYAAANTAALRPKSIGAGRSRRADISERAESLLKGLGRDK